ncbi:MAG: hypothetical protein ABSF25_02080 [Bryobacteraceae bacterium]
MATLIQGFGTAFIGQRDFWPDGSYVTTEWIVALFVPLFPLRSLRVKPKPRQTTFLYVIASTGRNYVVSDETEPHRRQVASVYAFVLGYAAWMLGTFFLLHRISRHIPGKVGDAFGYCSLLAAIAAPWLLPLVLRRRARRWRPGFK